MSSIRIQYIEKVRERHANDVSRYSNKSTYAQSFCLKSAFCWHGFFHSIFLFIKKLSKENLILLISLVSVHSIKAKSCFCCSE